MAKIQTLNFTFKNDSEMDNKLFCPFTGKRLIPDYEAGFDDFPDSMMMAFADGLEDHLHTNEEFCQYEEKVLELESVGDLVQFIEELDHPKSFLLITADYEGSLPFDHAQGTFLLSVQEETE